MTVRLAELEGPTDLPLSLAVIARTELRRLLRQGGPRFGAIAAVLAAVVAGLGSLLLIGVLSEGSDAQSIRVTLPVEVAGVVVSIVMSIVVVASAVRDASSGMSTVALALVPARDRWIAAQLLGYGALGAVAGACGALVVLAVAILAALPGGMSAPDLGLGLIGSLCATLTGGLIAVLSAGMSHVIRRAVPAVIALVVVMVVVPLALTVVAGALAPEFGAIVDVLVSFFPATLLGQALAVTTLPVLGVGHVALGIAGLALWAAAAAAASRFMMLRRDL